MRRFFRWLRRFRYKTVRIEHAHVVWTDKNNKEDDITYLLQENGHGKRRIQIIETGFAEVYHKGREHPKYLKVLLPWQEDLVD